MSTWFCYAKLGVTEIIEAWPGAVLFPKYGLYPGEEAILRVADLGQASKEGFVIDGSSHVLPCLNRSSARR